jgi:hypothetical protein
MREFGSLWTGHTAFQKLEPEEDEPPLFLPEVDVEMSVREDLSDQESDWNSVSSPRGEPVIDLPDTGPVEVMPVPQPPGLPNPAPGLGPDLPQPDLRGDADSDGTESWDGQLSVHSSDAEGTAHFIQHPGLEGVAPASTSHAYLTATSGSPKGQFLRNGELDVRKLPTEKRALFEAADPREWNDWLQHAAVSVLKKAESDRLNRTRMQGVVMPMARNLTFFPSPDCVFRDSLSR